MKVLYIVSAFPVLTETFVLREIRSLRELGVDVRIGQLRPLSGPRASGFDDLALLVMQGWGARRIIEGAICLLARPRILTRLLSMLFACMGTPREVWKVVYVLLAAAGLAAQLETEQVDYVRAHHLHTEALAASFIAQLLGIPYSITCHTVKTVFSGRLVSAVAKAARPAIADTEQVRAFLLGLGVSPSHIQLLRNGINVQEFPFNFRNEPISRPVLLGVGRLDRKKGFHVLLEACAQLKSQGISFQCVIIGDGEQRTALERQLKYLDLCSDVEMRGSLAAPELRDCYMSSTILVVPSIVTGEGETDGLPTVIIEALATGLPVVATDTAAIPEIIQDSETGVLTPANNAKELTASIARVLKLSHLREKVSREGRRRVEEDYNLVANAKELLAMVASATERRTTNMQELSS